MAIRSGLDTAEALRIGLADRDVSAAELQEAALSLARQIVANAPRWPPRPSNGWSTRPRAVKRLRTTCARSLKPNW
jgi:enoyl-CoA hydratase/carnithine racemase